MNPLTNVKNITKLNELELDRGHIDKSSWHDMYKDSAWVFIGGLAYGMTEGDVLAVFSQYGEIVNINLVRDKKTGKIRGFCFLCYANQKSTVLAVDNFNGMKLCGRTIRVDHVQSYRVPKEHEDDDEMTKRLVAEGCAPKSLKLPSPTPEVEECPVESKKVKKEKKKKKKRQRYSSSSSSSETDSESLSSDAEPKIKKEKYDPGYEKYASASTSTAHKDFSKKDRMSHKTKHKNQDSKKNSSRKPEHSDGEYEHWKDKKIASQQKRRSRSEESQSSVSSEPDRTVHSHTKYKTSKASYVSKNSKSYSSKYHKNATSSRKKNDSSSDDSMDSTSNENETRHSTHSSNYEHKRNSAKKCSNLKEKNIERKKQEHKHYDTVGLGDSHKHKHRDDRYSKDEWHRSSDQRKSYPSRSQR